MGDARSDQAGVGVGLGVAAHRCPQLPGVVRDGACVRVSPRALAWGVKSHHVTSHVRTLTATTRSRVHGGCTCVHVLLYTQTSTRCRHHTPVTATVNQTGNSTPRATVRHCGHRHTARMRIQFALPAPRSLPHSLAPRHLAHWVLRPSADLLDRDSLPMGLGGDYHDASLPRRPNHCPPR